VTIRAVLYLSVAVPALLPAAAFAQEGVRGEIIVTASALKTTVDEAETPVIVLTGDDLHHRARATLGETLAGEPGVTFENFGGGAGRPVIRGQTAPRVEVLSDSAAVQDASRISPDHNVVSEPLLLRGIEVLRGPATLRYGGGAIGGAVNLLDNKVPTRLPEDGIDGVMEARLGTADDEQALVGGVTLGAGNFAIRAEGAYRNTDDYSVPGAFGKDHVEGSYNDTRTYTLGGAWVGDNGYLGAAYTKHTARYGLPGHGHEYEDCHPHGTSLHCGGHGHEEEGHEEGGHDHDQDHDHDHGEEAPPFVDLRSQRFDVRGDYADPLPGFEAVSLRYAYTDYAHDEVEGEEVATTFRNKAHDLRLELTHQPIGPLRGVLGFQYSHSDFGAEGEEAFLIPTRTQTTALFVVETVDVGPIRFDLAARQEWQKIAHDGTGLAAMVPEASFSPFSVSGAAVWEPVPSYSLALSLARSQRAPNAQELYAAGVHLATNTFEIGTLFGAAIGLPEAPRKETAHSANLTLRKTQGPTTFTLGLYHQDFSNYIYAETLDQEEDFRLIRYTGAEAKFTGIDGDIRHQFAPGLAASIFGDYVRAKLQDGLGNLPRIAPARLGATVEATQDRFSFDTQYFHAFEQDRIAGFETVTPGYDMLNATLAYRLDLGTGASAELFVRGSNLFNELALNHTSFIKDASPLRGRNFVFGLKGAF
jgi:iron complex outermembrane receptor protein